MSAYTVIVEYTIFMNIFSNNFFFLAFVPEDISIKRLCAIKYNIETLSYLRAVIVTTFRRTGCSRRLRTGQFTPPAAAGASKDASDTNIFIDGIMSTNRSRLVFAVWVVPPPGTVYKTCYRMYPAHKTNG